MADSVSLTFDAFLHSQQLRKSLLRSFCSRRSEVSRHPPLARLLSLRVNRRHGLVYCSTPDTGTANWEKVLEVLDEVPSGMGLVSEGTPVTPPAENRTRSHVAAIDRLPVSYTRVIFTRHPLQRLISAFRRERLLGESLQAFAQRALVRGTEADGWAPLIQLCHPCLVPYDYVLEYGHLEAELGHLLWRLGFPDWVELPAFWDLEESLWSQWLVEQHIGRLPAWLLADILWFYRGDFAAFNFTHGLTLK